MYVVYNVEARNENDSYQLHEVTHGYVSRGEASI